MKCSESSIDSLKVIQNIINDIKEDFSSNSMDDCIVLIESQLKMIKTNEGIKN